MTEPTAITLAAPAYGCFRSRDEFVKAARLAVFGQEGLRGITRMTTATPTVRGLIYKHEAVVRFNTDGRVYQFTIDGKAVSV